MLATLLPIDSGEAVVAGYNVMKQPHEVRCRVGYVSQAGGGDRLATGKEDLIMQGRLYGMSYADAAGRAAELSAILDLEEFSGVSAGFGIIFELQGGFTERLKVTPTSRFALLMGLL